jgi:hypothetical protein
VYALPSDRACVRQAAGRAARLTINAGPWPG